MCSGFNHAYKFVFRVNSYLIKLNKKIFTGLPPILLGKFSAKRGLSGGSAKPSSTTAVEEAAMAFFVLLKYVKKLFLLDH